MHATSMLSTRFSHCCSMERIFIKKVAVKLSLSDSLFLSIAESTAFVADGSVISLEKRCKVVA